MSLSYFYKIGSMQKEFMNGWNSLEEVEKKT